jgi:benzodiazapine receptor
MKKGRSSSLVLDVALTRVVDAQKTAKITGSNPVRPIGGHVQRMPWSRLNQAHGLSMVQRESFRGDRRIRRLARRMGILRYPLRHVGSWRNWLASGKSGVSTLQIGNALAFVAVIVVNALAGGTKLLNDRNTADVSAAYPTLITPAGFTFSIWGIIYTLLFAFILFQLLPRHREDPFNGRVSYLFILSAVFNIAWLFLWQYDYILASVPVIFGLLASLIAIYLRLDVSRSKAPRNEKIWVHLPFSVYLGWITIASIADTSSALVSLNWNGFGIAPAAWAELVTVVALIIALTMLGTRRDAAYGLVVVWALAGIAANQGGYPSVSLVTEASAAIVAAGMLVVSVIGFSRAPAKPSI